VGSALAVQGGQQLVGIIFHRSDAVAREQFGEQPQHDFPILQHVGDAGRCPCIVLEHVESLGVDAHDIDAADMHVDVVGHLLAVHLRSIHRILKHELFRHDPGLENLAPGVDVADEKVDGFDALFEAGSQNVPFRCGKDAGQHVERDQPLLGIRFAVNGERDADPAEQHLGLAPAVIEAVGRQFAEPARKLTVGVPRVPVVPPHLVERDCHALPACRAPRAGCAKPRAVIDPSCKRRANPSRYSNAQRDGAALAIC